MKPVKVILEELHLLSADAARSDIGRPTLSTQVATAAKRNIQFIISNQLLSTLPEEILGNIGCKIVFRLTNPRCFWVAQRSMGLSPELAATIPELATREAIVQCGDYPAPFKVRVDEISLPPAPDDATLEQSAQDFLATVTWTEEAVIHQPTPDLSISGDALKVFTRIAENSAEKIIPRCDALEMDRAREGRARKLLEAKGFVIAVEQMLGDGSKFYELTPKGIEWALRNKVKVRRYKSSALHEYILNSVEKAIGALSPRFSFQRHSEIAREQRTQPDSVLKMPGGQRAILEICCTDMSYDAKNIVQERQVDGVDILIAVAPNQRLREILRRAVERCEADVDVSRLKPLVILDAGECLGDKFDWTTVFERQA